MSVKKVMQNLFSFIILILISRSAFSSEFFEYGQSIRALGMGNAYTAVVDDSDALFYNPAALANLKGISLKVLNLSAGLNGATAYQNYQDFNSSTATGIDKYSSFFGDQIAVGVGGKLALTLPYFGIAAYDSGNAFIELRNPTLPTFNASMLNDYGLVIGGAADIGPNSHVGINFKRITRTGSSGLFPITTFSNGSTTAITEGLNKNGVGYGLDLGFLYNVPGTVNWAISGVWKDLGYTSFVASTAASKPPPIIDERIIGIAGGFDLKIVELTASLDYKHINTSNEPIGKKLHAGLEFNLPLLDARAGFSQGYYSYGVSMDFLLAKMDVAYYSVELGEYPGQDEDRRIALALEMEFGFDPSFKLLDIGKARGRKLKLRR